MTQMDSSIGGAFTSAKPKLGGNQVSPELAQPDQVATVFREEDEEDIDLT